MKFSAVLPGYKGSCNPNDPSGKTNQPLVKINIPILLRYSAAIFDIRWVSAYACPRSHAGA